MKHAFKLLFCLVSTGPTFYAEKLSFSFPVGNKQLSPVFSTSYEAQGALHECVFPWRWTWCWRTCSRVRKCGCLGMTWVAPCRSLPDLWYPTLEWQEHCIVRSCSPELLNVFYVSFGILSAQTRKCLSEWDLLKFKNRILLESFVDIWGWSSCPRVVIVQFLSEVPVRCTAAKWWIYFFVCVESLTCDIERIVVSFRRELKLLVFHKRGHVHIWVRTACQAVEHRTFAHAWVTHQHDFSHCSLYEKKQILQKGVRSWECFFIFYANENSFEDFI